MNRLRIFGIAALLVGTMLVLQRNFGLFVFQWPLFIGGVVSMMVNGPHGGTTLQQNVGLALNFSINTVVYWVVLTVAASIRAWAGRRA